MLYTIRLELYMQRGYKNVVRKYKIIRSYNGMVCSDHRGELRS